MRTELGKIRSVRVGFGGYQEAQLGVSFDLGGESWGVSDFWGAWGTDRSESAKWTEGDRIVELGQTMMRLRDVLREAKKEHAAQLVGIPIECSFDGNLLKSWRVLKEVL